MHVRRSGKVVVLLAIGLPAVFGMAGLIFDTGLMSATSQRLQQATDAGATAGASELLNGRTAADARTQANAFVSDRNSFSDAVVSVNIPPTQGAYAGRSNCVEVLATKPCDNLFMQVAGGPTQQNLVTRSVAAVKAATAAAAVVVLDPNPSAVAINSIPLVLPSFPALIGGLEVLGAGRTLVNGAVLVNTNWGGVDEKGNPAGDGPGPPYGISCMPLISLMKLRATDIRVSGGVDNQTNYGAYASGRSSPLHANRMPVPDPLRNLPVPTSSSDGSNVNVTSRGGVRVVAIPLIVLPTVLRPGVYDWIEIISGSVVFQPGIYIIRGTNPSTGIGLNIVGGFVKAEGVMFYITNSTSYNAASGLPDSADGETVPSRPSLIQGTPSVVINAALINSSFSPLASTGSPFDGMLIFQRRQDYRPIVIASQDLLGGTPIAGRIYSKWGHVMLAGVGTYDISIVSGTARLVSILSLTLSPTRPFPPAYDVFLVE